MYITNKITIFCINKEFLRIKDVTEWNGRNNNCEKNFGAEVTCLT